MSSFALPCPLALPQGPPPPPQALSWPPRLAPPYPTLALLHAELCPKQSKLACLLPLRLCKRQDNMLRVKHHIVRFNNSGGETSVTGIPTEQKLTQQTR